MLDMQWQGTTYSTIEGKAKALCRRFYPNVEANTSDVLGLRRLDAREELEIEQQVVVDKIRAVLQSVKPDKCPRADEIPNCFLQAIGEPLVKAI